MKIATLRKLTIACISSYLLSGCATMEQLWQSVTDEPPTPSTHLTEEELEVFISEWKEAKPKIERLIALEKDMELILHEVNKLTKLNNLPAQYSSAKPQDVIESPDVDNEHQYAASLPQKGKDPSAMRQGFAVHLAYFLSPDSARQGWKIIRHRYPETLSNVPGVIAKTANGGQTLYSLRIGPFKVAEHAQQYCSLFKQQRYRCETVKFSGEFI